MKRIILSFAFLAVALSVFAAPVNRNEASAIASLVLKQQSVAPVAAPYENLYIFNGTHGFVILAADDRVLPLLGYSFDGIFDADDMAESTAYWLQSFDQNIQSAREEGVEATEEVSLAWESIRTTGAMPTLNRSTVSPLIATSWKQREPYNLQCPENCVAGCVSIAMAQIMKYWEYPKKGNGSHSYVHNTYGTQYADFGSTTYDWDNIPLVCYNSSPQEVIDAVSTLVFQAGVAVDMNYGPDLSSASSYKVADAMIDYFQYAPAISFEFQYNYSDSEWKTKLKDELDASRPTYYAGQTSKGGAHAFLCDGYDAQDNFHFNWGWGGKNDGYYAIGALNPGTSGPYNVLNYALFGIRPSGFVIDAPTDLAAEVNGRQVNLTWLPSHGAAAYKVYRDDELIAPRVTGTSYTDLDVCYGTHTYYVRAVFNIGDRSPRSNTATAVVPFSIPSPWNANASLMGNNLTVAWEMPFDAEPELAYGTATTPSGSYGYGGSNEMYWGQRFPASVLDGNAGLSIKSVSVYFNASATYTLYLCKGNRTVITEVLYQQDYYVGQAGWNELVLSSPMVLDYTQDLWVLLHAPITVSFPIAYCSYSGQGLENASFYSNTIAGFNSRDNANISWMMSVNLDDEAYTYEISRNGSVLASGLRAHSYVDSNLSSGDYTYSVRSFFNGSPCSVPATCSVSLANITVAMNNVTAGWVEGGGMMKVGSVTTVIAHPNVGCVFQYWMQNGAVVSTSSEYSFTVTGDTQLVAYFQYTEVPETDARLTVYPNPVKDKIHVESDRMIRNIEMLTLDGKVLGNRRVDAMTWDGSLEGYPEGVYILRLVTDEGVTMKKVVVE